MTGEEAKIARRVYIFASGWPHTPFTKFVPQVSADPAWEYHEFPCGHFVMEEQPERLREVMLSCAG
jgi:hypothetical protein